MIKHAPPTESALALALRQAKRVLVHVGVFSFFINLLMLTGSIYMLQIYDRVLASRSGYTLLYLTIVAAVLLATMAALELVRSRLLVRVGARFDHGVSGQVFGTILGLGSNSQPLRDLANVRQFLTGPAMLSLLDVPWAPVFLALVYVMHPLLGHVSLAGALLLFAVGVVNERITRQPIAKASTATAASENFAETSARNAEVVRAMGMVPGLQEVWRKRHAAGLALQGEASDRAGLTAATAKFLRFFVQVAILGVGAYLVIRQEITAGVMIAASIIMGRALAPVETAIGSWRGFLVARGAFARLENLLAARQGEPDRMPLPAPKGALAVDKVFATPPKGSKPVLSNVNFKLDPGGSLGITGPSAAGKSSLARLLTGVWTPSSGSVRLDGVSLADWRREEVGPYIGYLPQDIELFEGTVAANIARFGKLDAELVVEAATRAGAHGMILELPAGYDTVIGAGGHGLSGGQRQKIGLARAFYGAPPLIVLDEPTSNLDAEGEAAVRQAIEELRSMGRTVIVIGHRPTLLAGVDLLMVIQKGMVTNFGPTTEVMPQITRRAVARIDPVGSVPATRS
jgi:PrtD family type I secretion system ABC transporter